MNIKISIIIPVFNAEMYINQCLDSIIGQSYHNIEVICIDDGSKDRSWDILNSYRDPRIITKKVEHCGVSNVRNIALNLVTGAYVMFVDADDWIDLDTCAYVAEIAEKYFPDVVMWSYVKEYAEKSENKNIFNEAIKLYNQYEICKIHRKLFGPIGRELEKPENMDSLCTVWGKLYCVSFIKIYKFQFFDLKLIGTYEDGLFNIGIFQYARQVISINKAFYHYRKTVITSITHSYNSNLQKQKCFLYDWMKRYVEKNKLPVIYLSAIKNRICLSLISIGLNEQHSNIIYLRRLKCFYKLLSLPLYRNALNSLNIKYFPVHWKLFYVVAKFKCVVIFDILLFIIRVRIEDKLNLHL